ncbi:MAG TPA: hypothetical protein VGI60_01875 [Chthoniobacterales bacterium]
MKSLRKPFLLLSAGLLLLAMLDFFLAPVVVPVGIRLWLRWAAREEGLSAEIGKVEAPFLHEVTIASLRLKSVAGSSREISVDAQNIRVGLNFRGQFFTHSGAFLRSIEVDRLTGKVQAAAPANPKSKLDWRQFARLLPGNFRIGHGDFDVATGATEMSFRGVALSASAIESGKFFAQRLSVSSPILRQTFLDLRGATSWEGERLTIAGIPLVRGLDLEALTVDLSRVGRGRIALDVQLDAYGGTLRASFQGREREKFEIDVAGSAANISLAQVSKAIGFLEPVSGAVRASKFTFRGNPGKFLDATASVWMELSGFAWRARRADSMMLGATYYNRRLEVDQLYVRQSDNALTINGELLWPKQRDWTQLPFRGQVNATIPDLDSFSQLFGARIGDFTGALIAEGDLDSRAPQAHGRLKVQGKDVKFRGVTVGSLGASLQLKGREITLENLDARHGEDFLRGSGSIDLAAPHRFAARLTGAINDLGAYASLLPKPMRATKIAGGATFDWQGDGTLAAHSGTVQLFAHGLQLAVAPLRMPLDVTLEGSYSPQDIFFRNFQLASERLSLGGFLMLGSNFTELQALQLNLDGVPRASGTVFLPFGMNQWRTSGSWLSAFDEAQKFDVDLAVDHLDLAAFATALGEKSAMSGALSGKLAAFGPLRTLQVTTNWRLENFGKASQPDAIDFYAHYAGGGMDAEATATFGVSSPITMRAWLPLRLEKARMANGTILDRDAPFSFSFECPALFLETLPNDWRYGAERGLVSGGIYFSKNLKRPEITGETQLLDARLKLPPPWPQVEELNAHVRFGNAVAAIDPLRCVFGSTPFELRGQFSVGPGKFHLSLEPQSGAMQLASAPTAGGNLSAIRVLGSTNETGGEQLKKVSVQGAGWPATLSLTISSEENSLPRERTCFLDPKTMRSNPLLLRVVLPKKAGFNLQTRQLVGTIDDWPNE